MCIIHCRKYHMHNCNRDSHLYNYNKNCHPHIAADTVTCVSAAETSNYIIPAETVTCILATERPTNIPITGITTSKPPYMQPLLSPAYLSWKVSVHRSNRSCHLRTNDCRNLHQQKWCHSEILLVTIKKLSEGISIRFKFSTPCIT